MRRRSGGAILWRMTMYLSNRTVRPTGYELVEFIDVPPAPLDEPVPGDPDPKPLRVSPDDEHREG